jgi:hypothetical protein
LQQPSTASSVNFSVRRKPTAAAAQLSQDLQTGNTSAAQQDHTKSSRTSKPEHRNHPHHHHHGVEVAQARSAVDGPASQSLRDPATCPRSKLARVAGPPRANQWSTRQPGLVRGQHERLHSKRITTVVSTRACPRTPNPPS